MANEQSPKLALFGRGIDVGLVLLMYDALQIVKLQLHGEVGECVYWALLRRFPNLFFTLQYSFGPITATIVSLRLEGAIISEMMYH